MSSGGAAGRRVSDRWGPRLRRWPRLVGWHGEQAEGDTGQARSRALAGDRGLTRGSGSSLPINSMQIIIIVRGHEQAVITRRIKMNTKRKIQQPTKSIQMSAP